MCSFSTCAAIVQGAATAVYAATSADLDGISGAYLQDCLISKSSLKEQNAELAGKLWNVTERQLLLVRNMQRGQVNA